MGSSSKCFDWASSFYDYSRAIPDGLMRSIIDCLQEKTKMDSSSKILEVGVGTGRIAIPITEKLQSNTVGVDLSEEMLQKCQEKMSATKIQLLVADGLKLPFVNEKFDIILTCHVLHLLSNAYQFVEMITPLLVKHGYYVNLCAYVDFGKTLPFKIYFNKLNERGYRYLHRGDLLRRGIIVYLVRRKWTHQHCIIKSEQEIGLNDLVRFLRDRVFSHQRAIPDNLHQVALDHLYYVLEKDEVDLVKKEVAPATSHLHIFQQRD